MLDKTKNIRLNDVQTFVSASFSRQVLLEGLIPEINNSGGEQMRELRVGRLSSWGVWG